MKIVAGTLVDAIIIIFLTILTILIFSMLIEYLKTLWINHKIDKRLMEQIDEFEFEPKNLDISEEAMKEIEGILIREGVIDPPKEKNEEND